MESVSAWVWSTQGLPCDGRYSPLRLSNWHPARCLSQQRSSDVGRG
ncbi:hypothetical protein PpBr36_05095 [Pyricularia pennisetigena]|nr:hypothetical protein PpBr36_05095 [Pyricularia pennisetigena]TLS27108.1 hypothetical protein PpBr36_05095 [Pyricularia pennisetigena]